MTHSTPPTLLSLAPELLDSILLHSLSGSSHTNHLHLERLQLVCKAVGVAARRLAWRELVVDSPTKGKKLLETLRVCPVLGANVRSMVLKTAAFVQPSIFADVEQDELVRLCPSLRSLDSPFASFAPLIDGRRPLAAYPATLRSLRLGAPFASQNAVEYDSEGAAPPVGSVSNYLQLLDCLPEGLTSIKFSQLYDTILPSVPPLTAMPLNRLTSLFLDFVTVSPLLLDWLAPSTAAVSLEKVQIWCVRGLRSEDIVKFVQRVGGGLKEFMFKPKGSRQGTKLGNELVGHLPNLISLTLGDKACEHDIYSLLPSFLQKLVISLPKHHFNARLVPIATELSTRLTSLAHFELYSQLYFPPPLAITYPPRRPDEEPTGLRELRLSHITAAPGELEAFLAQVGKSVFTLATHHISIDPSTILASCPTLRRLELGVSHYTTVEASSTYFDALNAPFLNYLRIHFTSGVSTNHFPSLTTLDLVGSFPGDLTEGWTSGKAIDELLEQCRTSGVEVWVNGRMVETAGGMWGALVGQTGREGL